jgi:hypothetical protein
MFIPTGVKYTAVSWGGMIKEVTCAHCGVEFVYELRRRVAAEANAPLYIGMEGAKQRAAMGAHAVLVRTLTREHDMVPCPGCGRLQPAMNRQMRKTWLTWLTVLWVGTLILSFMGVTAAEGQIQGPGAWTKVLPAMSTTVYVAAVVLLLFKEFRSAATDRAQRKAEAQAEGYARLGLPRIVGEGWMWVRPTLFESPAVCCGCGAAESEKRVMRVLGGVLMGGVLMEARVCGACKRRVQMLRLACGAALFLLPVAGALGLVMRDPMWDGIDALMGAIAGAIVGGIAWAIGSNWFIAGVGFPIRFRKFRSSRDEVEAKFRSEAAAEEFLARAIQRMEERMAEQAPAAV